MYPAAMFLFRSSQLTVFKSSVTKRVSSLLSSCVNLTTCSVQPFFNHVSRNGAGWEHTFLTAQHFGKYSLSPVLFLFSCPTYMDWKKTSALHASHTAWESLAHSSVNTLVWQSFWLSVWKQPFLNSGWNAETLPPPQHHPAATDNFRKIKTNLKFTSHFTKLWSFWRVGLMEQNDKGSECIGACVTFK